tara:strand:+ start:2564 stop:3565 length:1002 start_codon:yes stop_codon:yes gene_type:complete
MSNIIINPFAPAFSSGPTFFDGVLHKDSGSNPIIAASSSLGNLDEHDAFTVNFWIKAGWAHAQQGPDTGVLFHIYTDDTGSGGDTRYNDGYVLFYHRQHNRMYFRVEDNASGSDKQAQNFWYFHNNTDSSSPDTDPSTIFGTGGSSTQSTYWSKDNEPHVNGDGYGMFTIVKQASSSTGWVGGSNVTLFWNGNFMGGYMFRQNSSPFYATDAGSASAVGDIDFATGVTRSFSLGSYGNGTSAFQSGSFGGVKTKFAECSIWNKALSVAEVEELITDHTVGDVADRTATNALTHSANNNLLHYWKLDTTNAGTDLKGNANFTGIDGTNNLIDTV